MAIPFTQFLMPDGRPKDVTIERPPEIETIAMALVRQGCRFEIEMLRTGEISMEIVKPATHADGDPQVIAGAICSNGPAVLIAVDTMVQKAGMKILKTDKPKKRTNYAS